MCGLNGWISSRGRVEEGPLRRMRDALAHRGPDGAGLWIDPEHRIGLGHRRLSIVDLSPGADQPMWSVGRGTVIVFNGEIYNHADLRAELEALGRPFATDHSDTEVLLAGFEAWGIEGLLRRLNGMFAFALFDRAGERLHLVRDRVGIKPLYLARTTDGWQFASEAKALFAGGEVRARLDTHSFTHYLSFRAVPAPRTLFEGVECLAPGERREICLRTGTSYGSIWWDPIAASEDPPDSREEAVDRLEALLEASIERRMRADVPVGLFLSGGVDSAFLAKRMAPRSDELASFTVHYPGHDRYNEKDDAERIAAECGTRHHAVPIEAKAYGDALARVAWSQDEPIAAPVCTSVWFLSRAARRAGVPVVLSGEGADELFIGYRNWLRMRDLERWNARVPDLPGRPLRKLASSILQRTLGPQHPAPELLRRMSLGQPVFWSGAHDFGLASKRALLGPAIPTDPASTYDEVVAPLRTRYAAAGGDPRDTTRWMSWVDLRFRLPQLMLPRVDKMGMAHSIEGRVPFLDHEIIEFVLGLPRALRADHGQVGKPLFKDVASRHLPHEFVHRTKRGFQAPVREWKGSALGHRYGGALEAFADRTGIFRREGVQGVMEQGGDRLWFNLANFVLWHGIYIEDVLEDHLPEVASLKNELADSGSPPDRHPVGPEVAAA